MLAELEFDSQYYKIVALNKSEVQKKCPGCPFANKLCQTMINRLGDSTPISKNAKPEHIEKIKDEALCLNS